MAQPTIPPRLLGPRMAVWGYFPFDGRLIDVQGTHADWDWAMKQWDRVAQAGAAVRLVVADQPYSRLDLQTSVGAGRRDEARAKFDACRDAEQLVFGRVYVAGGKLGLGAVGTQLDDPLRPGRQVPAVADQIDAWRRLYGDRIAGIYLDSGPADCTDPAVPGSVPGIPENYAAYGRAVRQLGYFLFVQAAQYPDSQPSQWLRSLQADFLTLWEAGVLPYRSKFQARDACRPEQSPGVPGWWDPGPALRWRTVHVVNDCRDAETMRSVAELAVGERNARTVWITRSRQDPNLGAVFDVLPPYWEDEVGFFRAFLLQEEKEAKDTKDDKENKEAKDSKDDKEQKDDKDDKEQKDDKDAKDEKEAKDSKDDKDAKDGKDDSDKFTKDDKDVKDEKETKEEKDGKDDKDDRDTPTEKQLKDGKDFQDKQDKDLLKIEKDFESRFGDASVFRDVAEFLEEDPAADAEADEALPLGRTFIRPAERPEVGAGIVADPAEPEERP
ncbi:hypothetical protein [Streptomyces sp. NPDC053367]|uniref:hypothetical protein n=1 Tax=Streptomyces sp. NPDC053367 TaxID=3365700 RepID=UPI0037D7BF81